MARATTADWEEARAFVLDELTGAAARCYAEACDLEERAKTALPAQASLYREGAAKSRRIGDYYSAAAIHLRVEAEPASSTRPIAGSRVG